MIEHIKMSGVPLRAPGDDHPVSAEMTIEGDGTCTLKFKHEKMAMRYWELICQNVGDAGFGIDLSITYPIFPSPKKVELEDTMAKHNEKYPHHRTCGHVNGYLHCSDCEWEVVPK